MATRLFKISFSPIKKAVFIFNFCLISINLMAQLSVDAGEFQFHDYQTVYSSRIALFENSEKQIKALRIDSVKTDTDSVFYPFATIQEVSENCFSPYKASWMGEKVVVKPDGTNLFFNRDGDTITLHTCTRLNESWIAFQNGDDFRVKATVLSIGLETFLGLTDSVKTISLTVIDKNENTLEHPLNNLQLKISKSFGFLKTLNFYLFPDITVRYPADRLEPFSLVGLTKPKAGIQNLTWFEVNDFQPGDELHVLEHKTGDAYLYLPYREYDNRCIYKYLERSDYADSIVYSCARKQSIETVYTDSTSSELFNDTIISVVKANLDFDKLPGEPVIKTDFAYQMHMSVNQFSAKIDPDATERFFGTGNCLNTIVGEGCFYEKKYWDGLGGPYYYCSGYVGDKEERKLVYYKKGETEWGEKLVIIPETDDKNPEFAPIGAEWYYNYDPDITLDDGYQKISVLKDTIIDNHNCRLLQIRNIGYSYFYQKNYNYKAGNIILYESGDTVHYYKNGQFYILYDFSAKSGDTFYSISYLPNCTQAFKVRVDSISNIEINDQLLKKFHITLNDSLQANYIEKIGYNDYLLPQFGLGCEILTGPHYPGPLRCYYDNEIGVYSTNIVSACDYITISDKIEMLNEGIRVFPNPANDFITISNPSKIYIKTIELTYFTGRVVQTWKAQETVENTLNIQHIPPGIYLLKATTETGIKTGKLVVQ